MVVVCGAGRFGTPGGVVVVACACWDCRHMQQQQQQKVCFSTPTIAAAAASYVLCVLFARFKPPLAVMQLAACRLV